MSSAVDRSPTLRNDSPSQTETPRERERARQLSSALNRPLSSVGIKVKVGQRDRCLYLLLDAHGIPNPTSLVPWLWDALGRFDLDGIDTVKIWGRRIGEEFPAWSRHFKLPGAPPPPPPLKTTPARPSAFGPLKILGLGLVGFSAGAIAASFDLEAVARTWRSLAPKKAEPTAVENLAPQWFEARQASKPRESFTRYALPETAPARPETISTEGAEGNLTPAVDRVITFKAVGDIVPGTNFPDYRLPDSPDRLLPEGVRAVLQDADLLFGNFEGTLTDYPYSSKDISRGGLFAFRAPPEYARLFETAGFDVMNLANNHSMDFGEPGWQDTVAHLEGAGIETLGEVGEIVYLEARGIPVAWVGFSSYDGHNSMHDLDAARELIRQARLKAAIVVVSVHGGAEGTAALHTRDRTEFFLGENRGNMVAFSRAMVDAGADLVLGHGPHVPRALEFHRGKLIAYSLGNFIGYRTLATAGATGDSMVLEVQLNGRGDFVSGRLVPVRLSDDGIPDLDPNFRTVDLVRSLTDSDFPNEPMAIDDDGTIRLLSRESTK